MKEEIKNENLKIFLIEWDWKYSIKICGIHLKLGLLGNRKPCHSLKKTCRKPINLSIHILLELGPSLYSLDKKSI